LERVQFTLKQFDLVFIFKDLTKTPLHINSIQSAQLDDVKNWLDSVDIPLSVGPVNLNWGAIMKTINESPYEFFQQGGWSFLGGATGGDESDGEDGLESESEFEADAEELEEAESSDAESDYAASDSDDFDGGSDGSAGDDSDEGDDWDELERKAAKSDMKRADPTRKRDSDDSDDDRPKKNKSSGKSNGKTKSKR